MFVFVSSIFTGGDEDVGADAGPDAFEVVVFCRYPMELLLTGGGSLTINQNYGISFETLPKTIVIQKDGDTIVDIQLYEGLYYYSSIMFVWSMKAIVREF